MVHDHHEIGAGFPFTHHRGEALRQRGASHALVNRVSGNQGLTDRGDGRGFVNERGADGVPIVGNASGGGDERPHVLAQIRIQGLHQGGEGGVAVLAVTGGVFDLFQGNYVRAQGVNGGHNLGFLAGEVLRPVGAAHVAAVSGDRVAFAVGVALAAFLVLPQGSEVVKDVEGGDPQVSITHRSGRRSASVGELCGSTFQAHHLALRLEVPTIETVLKNHRRGEGNRRPHSHRGVQSQVRQGRVLRFLAFGVIPVRPIIEGHGAQQVLRFIRGGFLPGCHHVGGLDQRGVTKGQPQGSVAPQRVVVGHRVSTLGCHQHPFEKFTLSVSAGQRRQFERGHRLTVSFLHRLGDFRKLGQTLVFPGCRRDGHARADLGDRLSFTGVYENRVGGVRRFNRPTRARGLQVVAVETALGIRGGHHPTSGDFLTIERGGVPGALNGGDGCDFHFGGTGVG